MQQRIELSLIHIPLPIYHHFTHTILSLLVSKEFINISFTRLECSLIVPTAIVSLFLHTADELKSNIEIENGYLALIVNDDNGVIDKGSKLVDLTCPLALAGISILFVSTYFSDYLIIESKQLEKASTILKKNYSFVSDENSSDDDENSILQRSICSSAGSTNSNEVAISRSKVIDQTMKLLKETKIDVIVAAEKDYVICCGARSKDNIDSLRVGIVDALLSKPNILSITISPDDPISFLLTPAAAAKFPKDSLLGADPVNEEDLLVPLTLDFSTLPQDRAGIVCGIAGRLSDFKSNQRDKSKDEGKSVPNEYDYTLDEMEITYLSTVKGGNVMVSKADLAIAIEALTPLEAVVI